MDTTTLIIAVIGIFILVSLLKFILKLPLYLITFGTLAAVGYTVYKYLYGM